MPNTTSSGAGLTVPPLRKEDEWPHDPEGESAAPWKDTWFFSLADLDQEVYLGTHLTVSPNRENGDRAAVLVVDGRREILDIARRPARIDRQGVGIAASSLEIVEPTWDESKRLVLRADLPEVSFEVELTGRFAAADIEPLFPGFLPPDETTGRTLRHLEHMIRFEGTLRWEDGRRRDVTGFGFRDRSWGWRHSARMFAGGWDSIFGEVPDATFGIWCQRLPDPYCAARLAIAWLADTGGVTHCTAATFDRDVTGRPGAASVTSSRGRTVAVHVTKGHASTHLPWHDADPDPPRWTVGSVEHFVAVADDSGRPGRAVANHAVPFQQDAMFGSSLHPGTNDRQEAGE